MKYLHNHHSEELIFKMKTPETKELSRCWNYLTDKIRQPEGLSKMKYCRHEQIQTEEQDGKCFPVS